MGTSHKLRVVCGFIVAASIMRAAGQVPSASSLNFAEYRKRVEPVFLKAREGGTRCYDCHSVLTTRLHLETLTPGNVSYTEAQSRKNFQNVARVISLSDPFKSPLLLHPLAHEVGGDPVHTGGKFWKSKDDPEWRMLAAWIEAAAKGAPKSEHEGAEAKANFEYFKSNVEPIFLKQRPGHARCYGCHVLANRTFHLEPLSAGKDQWSEGQSRKNIQMVLTQVVPGEPLSSRILTHPLAPESGGEAFHSGGRQFGSQADPDWQAIAQWVRKLGAQSNEPRTLLFVTNSAGDTIDVIDAQTNKVVQVIAGIELPHGIAFSPDGSKIYVSNESESVLDVVDRKSGSILKKVSLSGHPNNLAISKDGAKVLVGIRADAGVVDVIDTSTMNRVASIPVDGSVHNVFVTPDGKYAVSGSIENKAATVVDLAKGAMAWTIQFDAGVRPMAFEANSDGSTSRMFVQLSGVNGFAVVDFARHVEVRRIMLPDQPGGFGILEGRNGTPSHGIGISPDGRSLWVNSTLANATFAYSLPDLKLIGHVPLPLVHPMGHAATGSVPEWIVFTPDSKFMYVSNSAARSVSCIDTKTLKVVAEIAVGEVPKRMGLLALQ